MYVKPHKQRAYSVPRPTRPRDAYSGTDKERQCRSLRSSNVGCFIGYLERVQRQNRRPAMRFWNGGMKAGNAGTPQGLTWNACGFGYKIRHDGESINK